MTSIDSDHATVPHDTRQSCLVVHPDITGASKATRGQDARLEEAVRLAGAIDLEVTHSEVIRLQSPSPGTLFGKGNVERLGEIVSGTPGLDDDDDTESPRRAQRRGHQPKSISEVDLVIVNASLSPVQQRNLERSWKCKVIDRTGLILEIFGARARTKAGRLQVELASLTYQKSRLVRSWTHLERQRGGLGFVGGPGETQIETDRRLISERIVIIKRQLKEVERTRRLHRQARKRVPYRSVALVGYTNAGKSTLFNRLTEAQVLAKDQLFATLDPTMRQVNLPSGETAILSDTVGFISDLPHELVTAFHATLEEVCQADMILHVQDASHDDWQAQHDDVITVLQELEVLPNPDNDNAVPMAESGQIIVDVLNKIDLVAPDSIAHMNNSAVRSNVPTVHVSAITGDGTEGLLASIDMLLTADHIEADIVVGHDNGSQVAWLYEHTEVLSRDDREDGVHLHVRLSPRDFAKLEKEDAARVTQK